MKPKNVYAHVVTKCVSIKTEPNSKTSPIKECFCWVCTEMISSNAFMGKVTCAEFHESLISSWLIFIIYLGISLWLPIVLMWNILGSSCIQYIILINILDAENYEDNDLYPAWLYGQQQQQQQQNPSDPIKILHMNVTVLRECAKYPSLEMDESCEKRSFLFS